MNFHFGPFDLLLIALVSILSVVLAYLHSPRAKSMLFMLPIPFSTALVATGRGVEATHLVGMVGVWAFVWIVWLLTARLRVPILLADIAAIVLFCLFSLAMVRVIPKEGPVEEAWYQGTCAFLILAGVLAMRLPCRIEPGHRTSLPVAIKLPLVVVQVTALVLAKVPLRGFMPSFPMMTVFAVYESRHSLYTLAQRLPIFILGFTGMALVLRWLLPAEEAIAPSGYLLPLAAGWAVYLPVYVFLDGLYQRRMDAISSPSLASTGQEGP